MTDLEPAAPSKPAPLAPGWYLTTDGVTKRRWTGSEWSTERQPPPGWYPHPSMVNTQRYWDGENWTDNIAPGQASPVPQLADPGRTANGMSVSYVRQQQGHSLTKHLLWGWLILWGNVVYISISPNHYWHA